MFNHFFTYHCLIYKTVSCAVFTVSRSGEMSLRSGTECLIPYNSAQSTATLRLRCMINVSQIPVIHIGISIIQGKENRYLARKNVCRFGVSLRGLSSSRALVHGEVRQVPCIATWCHMLFHAMSFHVMPYQTIPYHTMPCRPMPYRILSTVPCHVIPRR